MMDPGEYAVLPGRVAGPMYSARLYQGRDHLLKSTVQGVHEHFRRFAWEDIQAFIVEETPWSGVTNLLLALVFAMQVTSFLAFTNKTPGILMLYLPVLAVIAALMAVNFSRGPTCKTYVQTAVTRERLRSLNRVRTARKVIDGLAVLIRERQAAEADREAAAAAEGPGTEREAGGSPDPREIPAGYPPALPEPPPKPVETGRWHLLGCLFMAIAMADSAVDLLFHREEPVWDGIAMAAFGASCAVCVAALISQSRNRSSRAVRGFGFLLLGYHLLAAFSIFGFAAAIGILSVKHPEYAKDGFDFRKSPWYDPFLGCLLAVETSVFLFGAAALARYRNNLMGTPVPEAVPVSHPAEG
ncbi:MAG TPA: hypothetical protein VJ385_01340 [Fibrobacteria bacterium]|nr:hypothetical protein [Fibrobacteria bacterium]